MQSVGRLPLFSANLVLAEPGSERLCGPDLAHPGPHPETEAGGATGPAQVSQQRGAELVTEVTLP